MLESAGWRSRLPLDAVVCDERWQALPADGDR
jgi:hypothetical protein